MKVVFYLFKEDHYKGNEYKAFVDNKTAKAPTLKALKVIVEELLGQEVIMEAQRD